MSSKARKMFRKRKEGEELPQRAEEEMQKELRAGLGKQPQARREEFPFFPS